MEISSLNDKLTAQKYQTETAVKTANDNAAAVHAIQNQLIATQDVLTEKATNDAKLAGQIATLHQEVKNVKSSSCLDPSIIASVAGVRYLQSGSDSGTARPGSASQFTRKLADATTTANRATDPVVANQMISEWIADLYAHDTTCMQNVLEITKLNPKADQ